MTNHKRDIGDDEIRIISSDNSPRRRNKSNIYLYLIGIVILLVIGIVVGMIYSRGKDPDEALIVAEEAQPDTLEIVEVEPISAPKAYTEICDTVSDGVTLSILTPFNASPELVIGQDVLSDSSAVLVAQAADIRADNGEIVGTYVINGELITKGEAKAGFCSIVNGEISVGVADSTPMLEQALMSDGYFFRQYPLVVGGQVVENKPKGRAIRKALAEIDGKICIVISHTRLTFHEFSQALVNIGVRNAIYIVGSDSSGFYKDSQGKRFSIGTNKETDIPNANFIVWR